MLPELVLIAASVLGVAAYASGVNTTKICGELDVINSGDYTLINNIWSSKSGPTAAIGYQCSVRC